MDPSTPSKFSPRKSLPRQRRPRDYSEAEVKQILDGVLTSGEDITQTVRQILEDCQSESTEPCRRVVFECCVQLLNSDSLQSQVAKELVGKLLVEVDSLAGGSLVGLMEQLIDGIKKGAADNGRSLELLPKTLAVISAQTRIRYQKEGGGNGEMEGAEFKSHLLNTLYSCKEIPMTSEELQFLIEKILRMMKSLSLSELPPLVYQLLVLSTKGHKTLVLEGIRTLFNQLDREILAAEHEEEGVMAVNLGQDELLQTEGTVILHITFALKQDQELGKEFLKNLKAMQSRMYGSMLSPFSIALTLSVARIHRFEDPVFDFLKGVILRSFKDEDRKRASKWMKEVNKDSPDMEKLVLDTIQHSVCGWDHVVQGLVMLGFHLMDSFAPRSSTTSSTVTGSPQNRACCLGAKILQETFKVHPLVHQEMVSQLINRILTNASAHVSHYIALLSDVVAAVPQVSLDSLPQLREAFSYLSLLAPTPAMQLLHAILPLVQFSASVRDSLFLVLRKSLFSRQIEARKIAVGGYLLLLRKFKVLNSLGIDSSTSQTSQSPTGSQVQVEVHSAGGSSIASGNEALCLEILGALRRCLTQQYEVRLSLYEGLYEVFCSNPKLAEPIIDLLLNHLQHYYESEPDITPPLKFEPCLATSGSEVHKTEPLNHLLCCLQQCVARFAEWEDRDEGAEGETHTPEVIEDARDTLQSLAERMAKSEPEDFELDKSADFSSSSSVGQKNRAVSQLVTGSYEALMEYVFITGEVSQESCEQTLRLHRGYQRVADILQEKAGGSAAGSKRGHGGSGPSRADSSSLSLLCVTKMLRAVFSDATPNHQQPLAVLRDSQALVKHLLHVALQKIHQIHDRGTCEGDSLHHKPEKIFKSCCSLGRVLFKQLDTGAAGGGQRDGGKKGKSVPVLCLEGFVQLMQTVMGRFPGQMEAFISSVNPALQEGASVAEKVHFFLKHFERMVTAVLNGSTRGDWGVKETQAIVGLIGLLANELDADSPELEQVYEWTQSQCKEQNVDDNQLTKALVSLLLTLTSRYKSSVKIIRKLSQDIHCHLGDIDEDIELECRTYFAIVNPRTASSSVLSLVYAHTETVLNDAEWLISRLKSESTPNPVEDLFEGMQSPTLGTQAEDLCSSLCERLMNFVVTYHELVQTAIPPGPTSEGLLKTVTKLYTVLANLVKYYVSIYPQLSCIIPNLRKLVEMVGTHLSQQVYSLIAYIQTTQTPGGAEQQDSKGKKGGRGKSKAASAGKVMVRKETRSIPSLIFAMEQFEKFLIQLSKKSKVNLMENFKRSTSRDFRINHQAVEAILNDGSFQEEEEEVAEGGSGESGREEEGRGGGPSNGVCSAPKAKKLKRS